MSTHASITFCEPQVVNGECVGVLYKSVYVHSDGYTSYTGQMLLDHYASEDRVSELISHGHMSCIKEKINPEPWSPHNFDEPQNEVCVFYHRDRGESWSDNAPVVGTSADEVLAETEQEYNYLFDDGKWWWWTPSDFKREGKRLWKALKEADCRMQR